MPGVGWASFANSCGRSARLASDDHFVEIVFCQVKLGVGVVLEELLNGAIGINVLHRVAGRFLSLDRVAIGHVVAAEAGVRSCVPRMEERQHSPARTHGGPKALDEWSNQFLWHVIQRGPEQKDVEFPARKIEVAIEEAFHVKAGYAVLIRSADPVTMQGFIHHIGHVHSVAQRGEEVDIGRRGGANVEDAQSLLGLEIFKQILPGTRVSRHPWTGQNRGSSRSLSTVLWSAEYIAHHVIGL